MGLTDLKATQRSPRSSTEEKKSLQGKFVLVTGGSRGIGPLQTRKATKGILALLVTSVTLLGCSNVAPSRHGDGRTTAPAHEPATSRLETAGSLYEVLHGLPGVYIGADYRIRIRGSQADPLIVVDGQPLAVPDLDFLNPRDVTEVRIGTMAEASRYGLRGGGGVIFIATKRPPARK